MIEIELTSSAIVARADFELFAYDGNDSWAFLSDPNDDMGTSLAKTTLLHSLFSKYMLTNLNKTLS